MSRIGKLPISIPSGVTITVDSDVITVKGAKGELTVPHLSDVTVTETDGNIIVTRKDDEHSSTMQSTES
jgi:large subunit ribosomal protein L6